MFPYGLAFPIFRSFSLKAPCFILQVFFQLSHLSPYPLSLFLNFVLYLHSSIVCVISCGIGYLKDFDKMCTYYIHTYI